MDEKEGYLDSNNTLLILVAAAIVAGAATAAFRLITKDYKKTKSEGNSSAPPSKLRVYGFIPLPPDPDVSPACCKLVTFLKMTKTEFDYEPYPKHKMVGSPKGKIPYAHGAILGQDDMMGDSTLIMEALVKADPAKYDLDAHLSKEERAIGTGFKVMLEESTYFALIHIRWNTDEFNRYTSPVYFASIPPFLRKLMTCQLRKKLLRDFKGQGTGLLDDNEIIFKAEQEINALSEFFGSKQYLFGDRITSFDATVYSHVAMLIQGDWHHPICEIAREHTNLVHYVERMRKEFWPELQTPLTTTTTT